MGGHQKSMALFQNLASCIRGPHHKNAPEVKSFPKNIPSLKFFEASIACIICKEGIPTMHCEQIPRWKKE